MMLGMNIPKARVTGEFAKAVREAAARQAKCKTGTKKPSQTRWTYTFVDKEQ